MSDLKVMCPDCGDVVHHTCNSELKRAIVKLLSWVPSGLGTKQLHEAMIESGRKGGWIGKNATPAELTAMFEEPFFGSQAWSYPLFGSKEEARSFHGYLHGVIRAAGLDPHEIEAQLHEEREARRKEEADRKAKVQAKRDERAQVTDFLKGKTGAPLTERIAKLDELLRGHVVALQLKPYAPADENKGDEGFSYLRRWLDNYYGGGISKRVNNARINKLEETMFAEMQATV